MLAVFAIVLAAQAGDIEIGGSRRLGLGVAAGLPFSVTIKWQADRRNGVSVHAGSTTTTSGLHTRVQYEQWSRRLRRFEFGDLGVGWQAGVLVNLLFGQASQGRSARLGISAGPLVELRLSPVPVTVFAEVAPVLYPLDLLPGSTFLPAGVTVAVGARVWLGRTPREDAPVAPPETWDPPAPVDPPLSDPSTPAPPSE